MRTSSRSLFVGQGVDTTVEAFIILKERDRVKNLKLKIGGGCGPADEPFVGRLRERLKAKVFHDDAQFFPEHQQLDGEVESRLTAERGHLGVCRLPFGAVAGEAWSEPRFERIGMGTRRRQQNERGDGAEREC